MSISKKYVSTLESGSVLFAAVMSTARAVTSELFEGVMIEGVDGASLARFTKNRDVVDHWPGVSQSSACARQ